MKYIAALLCMFLAFGNAAGAPKDPLNVQQVVDDMSYPGVQVEVVWQSCGQINAYYFPRKKQIILCKELRTLDPGIVRFIVAHEMGHAIIHQLDIPFTGLEEVAADELATITLILTNRMADVAAMAAFWRARGGLEDPFDSHTSNWRRFATASCMMEGASVTELIYNPCVQDWRRAIRTWNKLLIQE